MKIATALMFVYLSIVSLLVTIIFLASAPVSNSSIAATGSLLIYVVVALTAAALLILFRDRSREVLSTLVPGTNYQVVCRAQDAIGLKHVMSVVDLTTKNELTARIYGQYPPNGFWEKKTPEGNLVLVSEKNEPKPTKKYIWGWHTGGGIHEVI